MALAAACVLPLAAFLVDAAPLLACPGCAAAADQQVQEGFFWGLVFMMVSPWLVIGAIGGGLYLAVRRERREAVEEFLRSEADLPARYREESDVRKG